uniref:Sortilin-like n=1 Tax=Gouania willdenowi TaxID=441366 RepID=A0A8C5HUG5_GOUWI
MALVLRGVLLLALCSLTAHGSDFQLGSKYSGQPAGFDRRPNAGARAASVARRSLPAWLAASPQHRITRRSTEQGDSCNSMQGYEAKLEGNTHRYLFKDLSGSVSLAWVGDGSGVILALTTFQVPFFMLKIGQSRLYRSEDYGKSFEDVTDLINSTFIRSEFGIAISPDNSGKVILTGELSGDRGPKIFLSKDFGENFSPKTLPFEPNSQITYNPENSNVLVALSNSNELWLSEDFGTSWKMLYSLVCLVKWGKNNAIFFSVYYNESSCSDRGTLVLMKTTDYGKTIKTIRKKIYSFGLGGRFLFASVMKDKSTLRAIHVSIDQGETWNIAQLPAVGHEQFYSILSANDEMVFMHVDEPGDTGFGTVYASDDRGTVYSKSLERHLYTSTGGDTDFTNVTSLRGVFITSILAQDNSVQSVVSFDQGGEWVPLRKPVDSKCDSTSMDPDKCSLHIHAAYSIAMKLNVPVLPLTEPNAVGLIIAHGSVGDSVSVMNPDVYVSDDGGYSWIKALEGPHHYAILDSGGLLVAVEHKPNQPIDIVKFSTDEGQCWRQYNFTSVPIFFTGLASEPGALSMNVSIWGYRDSLLSQYWISITIDFKELLTRDCGDEDYVQWLAHSDDLSDPTNGCMLGYKEKFQRLKKDSVCFNGRDYKVINQPTPCTCTFDDFMCDFGYYRQENSSQCIEQPDLEGKDLEFCLHGNEEQLVTSGYRKIPGDKCEGGKTPTRKVVPLRQKCVSDLLDTQETVSSSKSVFIVIVVIIVLLMSIVAGVLFVKKYVCGGRLVCLFLIQTE